MRERISTVLFIFPDSREIRHMREPPSLGSRVRSRHGRAWAVAQVIDNGSDTYTATCVGSAEQLGRVRREELRRVRREEGSAVNAAGAPVIESTEDKALYADLLQRVKDVLSPRAIRSRRRNRHYIP